MPTDFRNGRTFPRPGRRPIGEVLWLARLIDKARAAANGTIHDYIYPCPMDRGVMDRWGVTRAQFETALNANASDEAILTWLHACATSRQIEAANAWLLGEKKENLDRQDSEEGITWAP